MSAEPARLPVTVAIASGEAIDGYLERLAAANGMTNPLLARRIRNGAASTTFLTTAPDRALVANLAALSSIESPRLMSAALGSLPSIDIAVLDPASKKTWRTLAARGWPPERGTGLCPRCLSVDGVWRLSWRHPWVTACARHQVWLLGICPSCGRRFRSHRTVLRPVDAPAGTCGNPAGTRGRNCLQPLDELATEPTTVPALEAQQRIDLALTAAAVQVLGELVDPGTYLGELKALTVLLLHLAIQPGGDTLAPWAQPARDDRLRSAGDHGARWGLAPPANLVLRGSALATADAILRHPTLDQAADALHPWTELTPNHPDGQLGWLGDHTTMTPTLTRLVMAATATRRRITTLLDQPRKRRLAVTAIPQAISADQYEKHLAGRLDVTAPTGRLYAALCLARRHTSARTWAEAATTLGLPEQIGVKTARACSAELLVTPDKLVGGLDAVADDLDAGIDFRDRENAVRRLVTQPQWYPTWARTHLRGSHATSSGYAITWLWTAYAHGHLDTSPAWSVPPDCVGRARYRRYIQRLTPTARAALIELICIEGEDT